MHPRIQRGSIQPATAAFQFSAPPIKIPLRGRRRKGGLVLSLKLEDSGVVKALEKAAAHAQETAPLMAEVARVMYEEVMENFQVEGRPHWRDLYPSTKKARARKGHWPGKILQDEGHLVDSISRSSDAQRAAVGTNLPYAAIQQFGGTITQAPRSSLFTQAHRKKDSPRGKKGTFLKGTKALKKGGVGATSGMRVIDIAARPFLFLPESGVKKLIKTVQQFHTGA